MTRPTLLLPLLAALLGANRNPLAAADNPVVQLPKVVVTETSLPEAEHWRYTPIPGFEILSQTDDAITAKLVEQLRVLPLVARTIWPAPVTFHRAPTVIILCSSDATFASFIPVAVKEAVDPVWIDRLFLKDAGEEVIVLACDRTGNDSRFKEIRRDYARRCLLALQEPPPDWFVTGMAEIITDADSRVSPGKLKIQYANLEKITILGLDQGIDQALYDTTRLSPAVREIIRGSLDTRSRNDALNGDRNETAFTAGPKRFNAYFASNHFHPAFEDVLRHNPSVNPDDYRMTCWAFVHLSAFGQRRGYVAPLRQLLLLAGKNPQGDMVAMFRSAFGVSPSSMGATVSEYSLAATSHGVTKEIPYPEPPPPAISDADPMQIGRLKASAYRLGRHPAEAEAELVRARRLMPPQGSGLP